jgi:outer membrane protein insertion porin family
MKQVLVVFLLVLMVLTGTINAAAIKEVTVTNVAGVKIKNDFVVNNMRSKVGTQLDPRILSGDIRRLYQTNRFIDIETEFNDATGILLVVVTNKPVVDKIIIRGNKEIETEDIEEVLTQEIAMVIDDTALVADKLKLKEKYDNEGHFNAVIELKVEATKDPEKVDLVIEIDEKKSLQTDSVHIHGSTVFSEEVLLDRLQTSPSFWRYMFDTGFYNNLMLTADLETIKRAYKERGYLDFKIVKTLKSDDGEYLRVDIWIDEGNPYSVQSVSVVGNEVFSTVELESLIAVKAGMNYSTLVSNADIKRITDKYNNLGYLDFRCYPQLTPHPDKYMVDIQYRINEGKAANIRDIIITGNEDTKEYVIRRELAIQPEDKANKGLINKSRTRLMNMGYFEKVDLTAVDTEIEELKDLQLKLVEKPTGQLGLGGGFSSADDIVGHINFQQSNFDLLDGWPFMGGGQRFSARLQVGSQRQDVQLSLTEPWFLNKPQSLSTSLFLTERFYDEYEIKKAGYEIGISKRLTKYPLWSIRHGHRLQKVKVDIDDDTKVARDAFGNPVPDDPFTPEDESRELEASKELQDLEANDWVSAYLLSFRKDTRNSTRRPTEGGIMGLSGEFQTGAIGSDNESAKLRLRWTEYVSVFEESVLKLHGELNSLIGDDPLYERYFGGGIGKVRGYEERTLGPLDENREEVGGSSFAVFTAELDVPFNKTFNGVLFTDAGGVWEDSDGFIDYDKFNISVGPGLRINLPIGVVELYYGVPVVDESEVENSGRFHFNMGYNF